MRCTACNEPTRVLETRRRADGATRRRRECTECGRRFSTEEWPDTEWLGELPERGGPPLESVRRRAIVQAARDENERRHMEVLKRILATQEEMLRLAEQSKEEVR